MRPEVRCEQCGILLTGMTVDDGRHTFCCESHRAQYSARTSVRDARIDRLRPAHLD
jgi:hypothetical protein